MEVRAASGSLTGNVDRGTTLRPAHETDQAMLAANLAAAYAGPRRLTAWLVHRPARPLRSA